MNQPVVHPLEGRADCNRCHGSGEGGAPVLPLSHGGMASSSCLACHPPAVAGAASLYGLALPLLLLALWGLLRLRRLLRGSGDKAPKKTARTGIRWGALGREGLLQARVLQRPVVGALHALLVAGLLVLALGSAAAQLGNRLLPALGLVPPRGASWILLQGALDVAGLAVLLASAGLLLRRLRPRSHLERSWQTTAILVGLLLLVGSGFTLEGLRMSTLGVPTGGGAPVGAWLASLVPAEPDPVAVAGWFRVLFWTHGTLGLALLAAVPWTRLRHALLVPVQQALVPAGPAGPLPAPFLLEELMASGQFDVRAGLAKTSDLDTATRRELLSCTGCGRCEERCPAVAAGSNLSPRKLIVGAAAALLDDAERLSGAPREGRALLSPQLDEEDLWACTTCGLCAELCPSLIQPQRLAIQLRRHLAQEQRLPDGARALLANLDQAGNPYGLPRFQRGELPRLLGLPTAAEAPEAELLYWVGCAATYDPRTRAVLETTIALLQRAGLSVAILGDGECCTGDPARRLGDEARFQGLALQARGALSGARPRQIVTHCPHCLHALCTEQPMLGGRFEVLHHSELLATLVEEGRLPRGGGYSAAIALHDPCYLGRYRRVFDPPRALLTAAGGRPPLELSQHHERSFCCGGGGGGYFLQDERHQGVATLRLQQALDSGAEVLATGCPFCLRMLEESARDGGFTEQIAIRDLSEIYGEGLQPC